MHALVPTVLLCMPGLNPFAAADAEKSARLINEKHPDLKAEVFSPNGNTGPYQVVIRRQMDRESAIKLRQKARQLGLPRDTYAQNYKQ
ncbi:MAG: hypothetical protein ACR2JB_04195 [Bryobacteraceae bacterium]